MKKGFRILRIILKQHYIFNSLDIDLGTDKELTELKSDNKIETSEPFSSLVIGLNGSGKSNLLRAIIDIFRELSDYKPKGERHAHIHGFFHISYMLDGFVYEFTNCRDINAIPIKDEARTTYYFIKNGEPCSASELPLPGKILASSIMLTDKYLVLGKSQKFDLYTYLGVRRTASVAGTRTYVKKTVEYIVNSIERESFIQELKDILLFLDMKESCLINYEVKSKKDIFHSTFSTQTLIDFYENYGADYNSKPENEKSYAWFGYQYYLTIKDQKGLIEAIATFCKKVTGKMKQKKKGSPTQIISYDIFDSNTLTKDFELIQHLYKLDLLSFPNIVLQKESERFDFEDSSSGEANFVSSVLGILSNAEQNSIILIDEPEISLHPNWQMKYVSSLKKMLQQFKSCHIIIATHSHFMVSDIKSETSATIGITFQNILDPKTKENRKNYIGTSLEQNTYGWSAEEVLYSIFSVRSVRNYFLEQDLTKLLGLIGQGSKNKEEIGALIQRIEKMPVSENDPLKEIIIEAKDFLSNND